MTRAALNVADRAASPEIQSRPWPVNWKIFPEEGS